MEELKTIKFDLDPQKNCSPPKLIFWNSWTPLGQPSHKGPKG